MPDTSVSVASPSPPPSLLSGDDPFTKAMMTSQEQNQRKADQSTAQLRQATGETLSKIRDYDTQRQSLAPPPPPQIKLFDQPKSESPWGEIFGQLALPIAVFGSLLTKQPLLNGLNAAADVNHAYQAGDVQRFNQALDVWSANTGYALQLHQYEQNFYHDALERVREGKSDAMAELEVQLKAMNDETALRAYYTGGPDAAVRMMQWRDNVMGKLPKQLEEAEGAKVKMAALGEAQQRWGSQTPQTPEQWSEYNQIMSAGSAHAAGAHAGKLETYQVKTPDGKSATVDLEQGSRPGEWYDATGKPYTVPEGAQISKLPPGQGRQQASQLTAIRGAGNEAVASLKNLVELPVTATAGVLMGLQFKTPDEMGEAIKRSLARNFTPKEVKDLYISFAGVGRSLATLEAQGRSQGLVGLSEQMDRLMPQSGDEPITIMRRYAEVRQIIDRSMENAVASGIPTTEAQQLFERIAQEAREAVPYTVHDVNRLEYGGQEGLREFADKLFAARGQGQSHGGALPTDLPSPAGHAEGSVAKDGSGKVVAKIHNGQWVSP